MAIEARIRDIDSAVFDLVFQKVTEDRGWNREPSWFLTIDECHTTGERETLDLASGTRALSKKVRLSSFTARLDSSGSSAGEGADSGPTRPSVTSSKPRLVKDLRGEKPVSWRVAFAASSENMCRPGAVNGSIPWVWRFKRRVIFHKELFVIQMTKACFIYWRAHPRV